MWGFAPLVVMLAHAATTGKSFTGADGPYAADQLQYLSWVRDEGNHLLAGNLLTIGALSRVFLHPMFVISGAIWKLTGGMTVAFQLWKPVAVVVLFVGVVIYVRRLVRGELARTAAILIGLFFAAPFAAVLNWLHLSSVASRGQLFVVGNEMSPAQLLWGYTPSAIAVGLMPMFLVGVEQLVDRVTIATARLPRSMLISTSIAGCLVSWLHPWQGITLLVIVAGLLGWLRPSRQHLRLLVPVIATAAPLLYYAALSHYDAAWRMAQSHDIDPQVKGWVLVAALAPLLVPAALGVRKPRDLQDRLLLLWPPAALLTYFVLSPSQAVHALEGISIPLGVLAVRGLRFVNRGRTVVTALGVIALVVPGSIFAAIKVDEFVNLHAEPNFLTSDEAAALAFLAHTRGAGGVLASPYLGSAIPALTGREVWDGHPVWTPNWLNRVMEAQALFNGHLNRTRALELIRSSGARFLVSDCRTHVDLLAVVGTANLTAKYFGCATVYVVRN